MSSRTDILPSRGRAARRAELARALAAVSAGLAGLTIGAFVYQAGLFEALTPQPAAPDRAAPIAGRTTVETSRATGFDRENQPYAIDAKHAIQDEAAPDRVLLTTVKGLFQRKGGDTFQLLANDAVYDIGTKQLDLSGGVILVSKDRFTARMASAKVDVEAKALTSRVPVEVELATGTIAAQGIEITDDGKRILFLNGVKATFGARGAKGDGTP